MNIRVSSIEGNRQKLDGGAMFGNAPKALWNRWHNVDTHNRIELACRSLLVETPNHKILCETGIGAFFEPKLAQRYGIQDPGEHKLIQNLQAKGIDHTDINFIILSHLHFDHAGGLLPTFDSIEKGNKDLLFPNAKIIIGKAAYQRCLHPHARDRASFIPLLRDLLTNNPRVLIVEGDQLEDVYPNHIRFFYTHGHTPGQMHTCFTGNQKSIFFCGDLIPGRSWLHIPITMGYDRYPELLIDEKDKMISKAVKHDWWMFYTHDPDKSMSKVKYDKNGRVIPDQEHESLDQFEIS